MISLNFRSSLFCCVIVSLFLLSFSSVNGFDNVDIEYAELCSNHGWIDNDHCDCYGDWTGPKCSIRKTVTCFGIIDYESKTCSNHGWCSGEDQCTCYKGWCGEECHDDRRIRCYGFLQESGDEHGQFYPTDGRDPSHPGCSFHGTCIMDDLCNCASGWIGEPCEIQASSCTGIV